MVGMMAEKQQQCRIHLQAKAKNFDFKLKASKHIPTFYNFFRFSLFLKVSHVHIRVSSDNDPTTKRKSSKSTISGAIKKFWRRTKTITACFAHKPSRIKRMNCAFRESISAKDTKGKGMIIHGLTQLKMLMETKAIKLLFVLILAMVVYLLCLHMKIHLSYHSRTFASRFIGKVWNWAITQGIQFYFGL